MGNPRAEHARADTRAHAIRARDIIHYGNGTMDTATAGREAEALAERLLTCAGLDIIARNFRCRHGEIDLIAREGETFVFCEVRLRTSAAFGGAAESITAKKQARIAAAARYFLTARPESLCRFDVLLLQTLDLARIRWIRNAFTL